MLKKQTGFTIVELLIVIVVIAILAAITLVSYNGIANRAKDSSIKTDLTQYAKKIETARIISGSDTYPADLSAAGISIGTKYIDATYGSTYGGKAYCLDLFADETNYYVITSDSSVPRKGYCGPMNGLVAWWPLNGDARDISGNNQGGQAINVTSANGAQNEPDTALSFNGSTSQILCGTSPLLRPTDTVTVTAWVYLNAAPSSTAGIFSNGTQGYSLLVNTSRVFIFNTQNTNMLSGTMGTGKWYFMYGRYDTGQKRTFLYDKANASGNLGQQGTAGTGTLTNYGTDVCQIGSSKNAVGSFINGRIDDVRVYNRALTDAELGAMGSTAY
jgi:prepilin-type N-terminal cleavage/methylation domain-containing protein